MSTPSPSARVRFQQAVAILADEKGRIRERLLIAYISQLAPLDPERDLPEALIANYDELKIRMNEDEVVGDTGNATKQIQAMSEAEASDVARRIFEIFLELSREPIVASSK